MTRDIPNPLGLDVQQLRDGRVLSTEAKVDWFEDMVQLAFDAGARDQLSELTFVIPAPDGFRAPLALIRPGHATGLRVPFEVALAQAAASLKCEPFELTFDSDLHGLDAPSMDRVQSLRDTLQAALLARGIGSRPAAPARLAPRGELQSWRVTRFALLRNAVGQHRPIIEGEWPLLA